MKRPFDPSEVRMRDVSGVTLIELMVALTVGAFLIVGAVAVFLQGRTSYRVTDSVNRLQDNMRVAIDRLEPDIRMANYWGLTTQPAAIEGRAGSPAALSTPIRSDCLPGWAVDVRSPIAASNDEFPRLDCASDYSNDAQPGADTITVRRVEASALASGESADAGSLYLQSVRFGRSRIFRGPNLPSDISPAVSQTNKLVANMYYVSRISTLSTLENPVPSLRVKRLVGGAAGPRIIDEEVLPGIEDMQIQFGIDADPPGNVDHGAIDRFVDPDDPLLDRETHPQVSILAVRLWLRLRTERPEQGFVDTADYDYANHNFPAPHDAYRRAVISKTIFLRNAEPAS